MPLIIELQGHREEAALSDAARAFFGDFKDLGQGRFEVPADRDFTVLSEVCPPISNEEVRRVSRKGPSGRFVTVGTRVLEGGEEGIREKVPLHEVRRVLKRQLYHVLSRESGISFPWGTLTGVRPTRIALDLILAKGEDAARRELEDYWYLSPEKADLAVRTARAEEDTLSTFQPGDCLLYAGLPFCPSRCLYCSFITQDAGRQKSGLKSYVRAVIREAGGILTGDFSGRIRAVYFGGGTPTSLPADLFRSYLEGVMRRVPDHEGLEKTMEAGRPDTIDREKLTIIREFGFNKLCINPQTMNEATLKRIGRGHTAGETVEAFRLARSEGFTDINMDLIAGLPGEGASDFLDSLDQLLALGPESITLHTLAVKKGSYLDRLFTDRDALMPDPELIGAVEEAHGLLLREGYRPYYLYKQKNCRSGLENTGFTRHKPSLYNVGMMSDQVPVVGLGSGSSSKAILEETACRIHNPKDLMLYRDRVEEQILRKRELLSELFDKAD